VAWSVVALEFGKNFYFLKTILKHLVNFSATFCIKNLSHKNKQLQPEKKTTCGLNILC
jgi:hypothetical protein